MTDDVELRQEAVRVAARRRETDMLWTGHHDSHAAHDAIHGLEHAHETELARHEEKRLAEGMVAHAREHAASREAIDKALAAVESLAEIHAEAHAREHLDHEVRHRDGQEAIAKAEIAMDKRLASLNEFRAQLRDQASTFATNERLDAFISAIDRRMADMGVLVLDKYETNRQRIETIEKGDVKAEGKGLGQSAVVGIIVAAIGVAATVISIIVVISNFATVAP